MSASLFLHLPPGTLGCADLAGLTVAWYRPDGSNGNAKLGSFLPTLEAGCSITLVLSAADVHLSEVTLNRQQARHLQRVLPFLLEEALLDEADALLFATGQPQDGRYPVVAVKRAALADVATFFRKQDLHLVSIVVDADLLAAQAPCLLHLEREWLLLETSGQSLVLNDDTLALFLAQTGATREQFTELDHHSAWPLLVNAAERHPIQLLQREWQLESNRRQVATSGSWASWQPTLRVAACLLLVIWLGAGFQTWRYVHAEHHWQSEAGILFQRLFPQDRATSKLRAQFQGHLAHLEQGIGGGDFLALMQLAGPVLAQEKKQGVDPQHIQYDQRSGQLLLDINAASYPALQTLCAQLQAAHLKADIMVAKTQTQGVSARIKVEQG